jgi:hypothetical protein
MDTTDRDLEALDARAEDENPTATWDDPNRHAAKQDPRPVRVPSSVVPLDWDHNTHDEWRQLAHPANRFGKSKDRTAKFVEEDHTAAGGGRVARTHGDGDSGGLGRRGQGVRGLRYKDKDKRGRTIVSPTHLRPRGRDATAGPIDAAEVATRSTGITVVDLLGGRADITTATAEEIAAALRPLFPPETLAAVQAALRITGRPSPAQRHAREYAAFIAQHLDDYHATAALANVLAITPQQARRLRQTPIAESREAQLRKQVEQVAGK